MSHNFRFDIEPGIGIGPVRFGMSKEKVSRLFTFVYRSFFKTPNAIHRSDQIEVVGLIVHYDDAGIVDYIEAVPRPTNAAVRLYLFGDDVTNASVARIVSIVKPHCSSISREATGYVFSDIGLNTYNDVLESEDDLVQAFGLERLPSDRT